MTAHAPAEKTMTDAEQAAYWKGAYERMVERNSALSSANGEMLVALSELLDANSHYFPRGNPWGDQARAAIAKAVAAR